MELAERLIEETERSPRGLRAEQIANDLLGEFFRGFPVERLRPLLQSQDADTVATGAWIASELGEKSKPILGDVLRLLKHSSKKVRFWALDCLLWASSDQEADLVNGVSMMDDAESAIRWKALDTLTRMSAGQLGAALKSLSESTPESVHVQGLRFLLGCGADDFDSVISHLNSDSAQLRKYGLIAAVRLPEKSGEALEYAQSINDPDIQSFIRTRLSASA
jgi:hypothetical protein